MTDEKPQLWRRVAYFVIGDRGVGTVARLLVALTVLVGLLAAKQYGFSLQLTWATAVAASYAAILVTSPTLRGAFQQGEFVGNWSYHNTPDREDGDGSFEQASETVRVVKIDRDQGDLRIRGWLNGEYLFDASRVVVTSFGRKSGNFLYWYKSPEDAPQSRRFFGLVVLEWHKEYSAGPVSSMLGRYYGHRSGSIGTVSFARIGEEDFLRLRDEGSLQTNAVEERRQAGR